MVAVAETPRQAPAATPAAASDGKPPTEVEKLQGQLFGYLTGAVTSSLIAVGDKLGLYKSLKHAGPCTSAELALSSRVNERFVREWLYQQACAGCVSTNAEATSFWLSEAQQAVLANEFGADASPAFCGGFFAMVPGMVGGAQGLLLDSFRSGRGFNFDALSDDLLGSCCRTLGVWTRHFLAERLTTLPGMKDDLEAGIKIADIGCGSGEVLITLAKAFPKCEYHGYDISTKSLDIFKKRLEEESNKGLNITLHNPLEPGQALPETPTFDLVITMDAVHDMAYPEEVLHAVRKAIKDDGSWIINDPKGKHTPAENIAEDPGHGAMFYGMSCHCCLPSGLSEEGGLGLGTLGFQEPVARKMAAAAGFTRFEVLDWESPMNNVFQLMP